MTISRLTADQCGLPRFRIRTSRRTTPFRLFDFSSHRRAGEALKFGLSLNEPGFNVFVLGEDRSGRMTATMDFLNEAMTERPAPDDWVYLNNFRHSHRPKPYRLPNGAGRRLKERMEETLESLKEAFLAAFDAPDHQTETGRRTEQDREAIKALQDELKAFARERNLDVQHNERGIMIVALNEEGEPMGFEDVPEEHRPQAEIDFETVADQARETLIKTQELEERIAGEIDKLQRVAGKDVLAPAIQKLRDEFPATTLGKWFGYLEEDILDNLDLFDDTATTTTSSNGGEGGEEGASPAPPPHTSRREPDCLEDRYAVNVLVDHGQDEHPQVILEPSPSYENLFGAIQYRPQGGTYAPHFSLIKPGALHKANGGILVLRAEALVDHEDSYNFLKAALRDQEIRIEEPHKAGAGPLIAGSPDPHPIPLDVKVVIVGAPRFYYTFFSLDADFRNHFRVKADIDADMPAEGANIAIYTGLMRSAATDRIGLNLDSSAIRRLLGQSARWAEERTRLTSRFEQVVDVLIEAGALAKASKHKTITESHVSRAIEERRHRNSRMEDRTHERIQQRETLIDTYGHRVGQVNSLTVVDHGDHTFGTPARVTAVCYVGSLGVINIERATDMSGPLQQKAVLEIEAYLKFKFAQNYPLSFSASLTFEQNYGGIEGDSASMAELCALLSALSDAPLRQSIGVTGSLNQFGECQAVGGITHKIEGFYRVCADQGFTGDQGIIIPAANVEHLNLRDEVVQAVRDGLFHIYAVDHVADAMEVLTELTFGEAEPKPETILGRTQTKLARYDEILTRRSAHGASEG